MQLFFFKTVCFLPFTAIFINMPNFINILPRASSLGPLMCFTFDHLLCPAQRAEHRCSVLTELFQAGYKTHEAGRTVLPGTRQLPVTADRALAHSPRSGLRHAAPAMPFTQRVIMSVQDSDKLHTFIVN